MSYSTGGDDTDDFNEYDPTSGGYDLTLTAGRPIRPSTLDLLPDLLLLLLDPPTANNSCASITEDAINQAGKALLLDPRDAAAHFLIVLALDLQAHKSSALRSLDVGITTVVPMTVIKFVFSVVRFYYRSIAPSMERMPPPTMVYN